jgi:hypothetical protein
VTFHHFGETRTDSQRPASVVENRRIAPWGARITSAPRWSAEFEFLANASGPLDPQFTWIGARSACAAVFVTAYFTNT